MLERIVLGGIFLCGFGLGFIAMGDGSVRGIAICAGLMGGVIGYLVRSAMEPDREEAANASR